MAHRDGQVDQIASVCSAQGHIGGGQQSIVLTRWLTLPRPTTEENLAASRARMGAS